MTVRMGYDFAMRVGYDASEATPLCRGRDNKNDIRVKRQRISAARGSSADIQFYIAVKEE